jgi:pre-mRNA-splicing factor 38B
MTLVDEMYNEVTHVEPWMSGNARGPSTAFCILYRLFTLAPTRKLGDDGDDETQFLEDTQIKHLLDHGDSPYIRAIGFLYLRYVCPHKKLLEHLEPYLADDEKFAPTNDPRRETTMGAFVRDLILDQHYFETIFPRIPEVTRRTLVKAIEERGLNTQPAGLGGVGGASRRGDDGRAWPQSSKAALSVNVGQRAPHVKGAAERGRGIDPGAYRYDRNASNERRERDDGWSRGGHNRGRPRSPATGAGTGDRGRVPPVRRGGRRPRRGAETGNAAATGNGATRLTVSGTDTGATRETTPARRGGTKSEAS